MLRACVGEGWTLYGIDGSPSGIEHARRAMPGVDLRVGDVSSPLNDHPAWGRCDLVLSTEVVEHLYDPRGFARNCHGFLKPGGRLVISTPYHGYLKNLVMALTGKMDGHFTVLWDGGHIKFWSRATLGKLLQEAGLRVTAFHGVGRAPGLWKSMVLVAERPAGSEE